MYLFHLVWFILFKKLIIQAENISVRNCSLNENLSISVEKDQEKILRFNYNQQIHDNKYLRVYVEALVEYGFPVLIILRDDNNQVIHMKLTNFNRNKIAKAERTICPIIKDQAKNNSQLMVDISTESSKTINVTIIIKSLKNFQLRVKQTQTFEIDVVSPVYYMYKFEDHIQQVNVIVDSKNKTCMTFSIQHAVCPVYDMVENVKFKGMYQSVTFSGSITIEKSNYDTSFIVFVVNYNDAECGRNMMPVYHRDKNNSRTKSVSVTIEEVLSRKEYIVPILGMIAFYLSFFVASLVISFIYHFSQRPSLISREITVYEPIEPLNIGTAEEVGITNSIFNDPNRRNYNSIDTEGDHSSTISRARTMDSNDGSYDSLSDISTDPNLYRLNTSLYVSDLSKKHSAVLNRKYFLYLWYLIIISVFYALPVVQLVITYQKVVRTTGNEDVCYYNFKCTRPFYIFTAFNNIISNVGYVLLGVLYTLITWRRHSLYNECKLQLVRINKNQGIPQYYGLFYAMGVALTMEGILSACYHICPSDTNFQFDTAYMYILACLCMIKIYQTRHPDVNASAHSFYMTMSFIIFVGVIGVVYNILLFWIFFTICYIAICILLTMEIYYMGRWSLDIGLPRRIYLLMINDRWRIFVPTYRRRMTFLLVLNVINVSFALYGVFKKQNDFASFFLAIFMFNLLLYFGFYIIMKMKHCEHFHVLPIVYVIIAIFCWGFAIYCFINHTTDWQLTPAESREQNQPCIFLDFYDLHDIWHFLSSMSMFFSFLALQNLDDSLFFVDRDKIPVF